MILDKLLPWRATVPERRPRIGALAPPPDDDYWYEPIGQQAASGVVVTADTALRVGAVYACVRVLAESVASLPLFVYRRLENGGKGRATDHYLYNILHTRPNSWQSSFEFREFLMTSLLLRGNAYAIIDGRRTAVDSLRPCHPDGVQCKVRQTNGEPVLTYYVLDSNRTWQQVMPGNMLHIRGMSLDSYSGLSPIEYQRDTIGNAVATDRYAGSVFKNGARPGGVLEHPASLTDKARENLRASWQAMHGGPDNANKTAILEEGLKFHEITMTSEDAQFIENRKYNVTDIARIFRVPPHMIGDLERATFSNIEHQSIEFVTHSLRPWLVRIEQAFLRSLFQEDDGEYFAEFLVDGLLRGDAMARAQALQVQFMNGAISADEWREIENRNPLPDELGQTFYRPANLVPVDEEPEPELPPMMPFAEPDEPEPDEPEEEPEGEPPAETTDAAATVTVEAEQPAAEPQTTNEGPTLAVLFAPLVEDAAERIHAGELRELARWPRRADNVPAFVARAYHRHQEYVARTLTPVLRSWRAGGGGEIDEAELIRRLAVLPAEQLGATGEPAELVTAWREIGPARIAAVLHEVLR